MCRSTTALFTLRDFRTLFSFADHQVGRTDCRVLSESFGVIRITHSCDRSMWLSSEFVPIKFGRESRASPAVTFVSTVTIKKAKPAEIIIHETYLIQS